MSWDPDAKSEDASEYDGIFSHATETHSAIIGASAGTMGAVTRGTEFEVIGTVAMLSVLAAAFGLEAYSKMGNSKTAGEVAREPWYALGCMVLFFLGLLHGVGV